MKAIVLGGVAPHIALIERLKRRGYYVILIDYLDNPPAKNAADRFMQVSTLDIDKVYDIAKSEGVDVVMATCVDHANVTMCTVAERLGLPHPYSLQTANMTTSKVLMKSRMRECGIPTSDFLSVASADEVPWDTLSYPLVVKPADCNGSKGVKRVDSAESLRKGLEEALELSRGNTAIIEGFVDGREIQVDCFANAGVAHVITMREKLQFARADGVAMQVYGSVAPAQMSDELAAEYRRIAQRIAEAFGLSHTPFFFQSITDGTRIDVIEISPRIGGGLSYKLIKESVGVDMIDLALNSYFGDSPAFEAHQPEAILASTIVYAKDGVFSHAVGIDQMIADGTVRDWDLIAAPGSSFGGHMDSRNRVGAYYSVAMTYDELKAKTKRAESAIDICDADGRSIKVRDLYYR